MAADEGAPDERSAVADAIGGAAAYSARVAARVWRGPLEAAAEELLSTPEVRRALDRTLSSPLPEELGQLLVRHRVVERVVHELVASGELERTLETTLASPQSQALVDRLLASPAMHQALERVLSGPEVRAALTSQTTGLADEVLDGVRERTTGLDSRLSLARRPAGSARTPFAGVASRGVALVVDAFAIVAGTAVLGGAASLVGGGGRRPAARVARRDAPLARHGGGRDRVLRPLLGGRRPDARDAADARARPLQAAATGA